ncbi:MAG: glycosyltransferase family 2 protein [Verrucomicrobiota bacterium]|nr:glycosyltransferase family 2 protein [Verrucomicrobiota bacterium]
MKKRISVLTPCYNEEANIASLVNAVKTVFQQLPQYDYEHVFIDNLSTDRSLSTLREIARTDKNVKVIANARNFGWIRSPFYGLTQCKGDAVVYLVADFQDPPDMIFNFVQKWQDGFDIVIGVKNASKENLVMFALRGYFYKLMTRLSASGESPIQNFTGFGLYDQKFITILRDLDDPYPYFRGLITELGFNRHEINYTQPQREGGKTSASFFKLYDVAVLGFTSHSKLPLRLSAFIGFFSAILSFLVALGYTIYKLVYWYEFTLGIAPLVIGVFFFASIQLFFIGIIGEYIGAIHTHIRKRPLVIERERINFD